MTERLRLRLAVFASCYIHESTGLDLVQDWITLELAVRIHIEKGEAGFAGVDKTRLKAIFKLFISSHIQFNLLHHQKHQFYRLITSDLNYKFSSD